MNKYPDRPWVVYCIHDLTNDSYYIGITCKWRRRFAEHGMKLPQYTMPMPEKKFGTNDFIKLANQLNHQFEYSWIEGPLSFEDAKTAEIYWIQTFKNKGKTLYNKTCGGLYDEHPGIQYVDISGYHKRYPLPMNLISKFLQCPELTYKLSNDLPPYITNSYEMGMFERCADIIYEQEIFRG